MCECLKGFSHPGRNVHHDLTECHALVFPFPFLRTVVQVQGETEPVPLSVPSRKVVPVASWTSPAVNPSLPDRAQGSKPLADSLRGVQE